VRVPPPYCQALHAAVGQALEVLYAHRLEEVYDHLAYHYSHTQETQKAVDYLSRFAERVARSYAHGEAITALQKALVHATGLPAEERDRCITDLMLRLYLDPGQVRGGTDAFGPSGSRPCRREPAGRRHAPSRGP
jgi:hypothetical protein